MSRIAQTISRRIHSLTDVQLRFVYTLMAAIGLAAGTIVATNTFRHLITHSDECVWSDRLVAPGTWSVYIAEILPGGRADLAGLKVGDRVLAINGSLVGTGYGAPSRAQDLLDAAPVETPIPYVVERDGRVIETTIELMRIVRYYLFAIPALSILWIMIGLMVVFSRPRGQVQFEFFVLAVTSIFALLLLPTAQTPNSPLVMLLWGIAGVTFYLTWFHFFSIFPVDQKIFAKPRNRRLFYAPASLMLVVALSIITFSLLDIKPPGFMSQFRYATFGIVMLYFIGGIVLLYRGYRQLAATPERRPITVILIGSILAGVVLLYFTVLQTTRSASASVLYPQYLIPLVLVLALPVSFGWAIFKHQVMDFRPVMRATVVYGASMLLLGGLYLSVAYGVGQLFGSLTVKELQTPVELLIFVSIALAFEPMKRQLQTTMENRFFPQRRDYSQQLADYVEQIAETVGTRGVAGLMASTLRRSLELRGCWILLEDSSDGFVQLVARDTEYPAVTLDESDIDTLRSLLRGQHTLIPLETAGDAVGEHLQASFAYVIGLYAQGRVIGAVLLSPTESGEPLSGSQTPFILGVTTHGASALEVARLYEQELRRQRYQEELATARRIQESLLPATMPNIPGISISAVSDPAQTVGGDYYEMIQLDAVRYLVMIADVSGKGLPASLYMAELHGMVRIASAIHTTPKNILTMLNKHLYDVIERGSFITATLLLFDTERRTVSYARAGHTPIIRRSGSQIDTLVPAGIGLGMNVALFERHLQEYTVNYEPGETFILYSDGVSEAMNGRREEFGEGRLIDVISAAAESDAQEICDGIIQRIVEFRGGAEPNDDVTVVVIRIERDAPARPRAAAAHEATTARAQKVEAQPR